MHDIQAVRTNEDDSMWEVALTNGKVHSVPQDKGNRHARQVQEWIDDGGTVDPYVPPTPPTDDEQIDGQDRIFTAFLKAYARRMGITPAQLKADIKAEL